MAQETNNYISAIQQTVQKERTSDSCYIDKIIDILSCDSHLNHKISSVLSFMLNQSSIEFENKSTEFEDLFDKIDDDLKSKQKKSKGEVEMDEINKKIEFVNSVSALLENHRTVTKQLKISILDTITSDIPNDKKIETIKALIIKYRLNYKF